MKPEPGTATKITPAGKKGSIGKHRQPLQERNVGPVVKAEPGIKDEPMSETKSYERSGQPRRIVANWSDDED